MLTVNKLQVNNIFKIIRWRKGEIVKNDDIKKMRFQTPGSKRFIEIDMLRGLALILMIFGHVLWDLDYFGIIPINNSLYSVLQKIVPPLFFLLVGLSLIVSRKKIEDKPIQVQNNYYKHLVLRGLRIFSLGSFVDKMIVFSILFVFFNMIPWPHSDGCSMFLGSRLYFAFLGGALAGFLIFLSFGFLTALFLALVSGSIAWFVFYWFFEKEWG